MIVNNSVNTEELTNLYNEIKKFKIDISLNILGEFYSHYIVGRNTYHKFKYTSEQDEGSRAFNLSSTAVCLYCAVNYYDIWKENKKLNEDKGEDRITFNFINKGKPEEYHLIIDDFYEFIDYALEADDGKTRDLFSSLNMISYTERD